MCLSPPPRGSEAEMEKPFSSPENGRSERESYWAMATQQEEAEPGCESRLLGSLRLLRVRVYFVLLGAVPGDVSMKGREEPRLSLCICKRG